MSIDREYLPAEVERRWAEQWAAEGIFQARPDSPAEPFCMVIPPPNVTGDLHIGHVLVYTLHDIVARWRRMQGHDVLWLPGTDHAGIATQMVVERQLAQEQTDRHRLGREAFEKRVWEWKGLYGGKITRALRDLGSSVDWSRERFTMDEGLSRAVRLVFVRLYREGLIYRDRYIVNWCPRCRTALSDLETIHQTVQGQLYTLRYPAADGKSGEIRLATTRPETLLGDTAVAVHPDDDRYRDMIGKHVRVPLTGRSVPVVADGFVDREFGTGAVKVTPAHDPNDFLIGRRLGLPQLVVIDEAGTMTEEAGAYRGLERFEARRRVLADLDREGLLVTTRPHEHAVGHCQRCATMIEPLVSTQWFVKVEPLAGPAIEAVEQGRIRFVPETWAKTYFEWMRNIHDWCISRQLWWGHRIPAWYCDACDGMEVAESAPSACSACGGELRQDADVLDTWFSSALWPFSTLGWPERTADLRRYYPTRLLITGHDIIFFWVARMIMLGLKFMDDVPFREVYIHGLVRDAEGQKMSKSKGNTVHPVEVAERYGTDAVRFTMAILAAPGNDIPLAPERMEGYRAFANKLWNASRFVLLKVGDAAVSPDRAHRPARGLQGPAWEREQLALVDRWILSRTEQTLRRVTEELSAYRFDRAADILYHLVWHQFCDWYIEFSKPALAAGEGVRAATTRSVLLDVLDRLLRMLHPFMPFITEELWHRLPGKDGYLALATWPEPEAARFDPQAEAQIELLQELVAQIRNLRVESNIDAHRRVSVLLATSQPEDRRLLAEQTELLRQLVRADDVSVVEQLVEGGVAARGVVRNVQIAVPLEGLIDLAAERARLSKDLARVDKELQDRMRRLSNAAFIERAPADVVEKERRVQQELLERKGRLAEHLALLDRTS